MQSRHRVARFPCEHWVALLTQFLRWTEDEDAERGEDVRSVPGAAQAFLLETALSEAGSGPTAG